MSEESSPFTTPDNQPYIPPPSAGPSGVATRDTVAIVSRCSHNGSHILQKWLLKGVVNDVLRSVILLYRYLICSRLLPMAQDPF